MKKIISFATMFIGVAFLMFLGACVDAQPEKAKSAPPPVESSTESAPQVAESGTPNQAPGFSLKDIAGNTVQLSDYKGKVIILDFWATWCPPCVKEIPHFNELAKKYGKDGLVVLGVSVDRDGIAAVEKFKQNNSIDYPVVFADQATQSQYQALLPPDMRGGIPYTFVIDRSGNIAEYFVGYRPIEVFVDVITPLLGS